MCGVDRKSVARDLLRYSMSYAQKVYEILRFMSELRLRPPMLSPAGLAEGLSRAELNHYPRGAEVHTRRDILRPKSVLARPITRPA